MLNTSLPVQKVNTPFMQNGLFILLARQAILIAGLGTLALFSSAHAATFYKWVDKAGSTHYTQTPPGRSAVRAAKKVYIDDQAPSTPAPAANVPATGESSTNVNGNSTSAMNSTQLATAANNAAVPGNGQQVTQTTTQAAPSPAAPAPAQAAPQPQPVITPVSPPPANRLIVPTQDQSRPAFAER